MSNEEKVVEFIKSIIPKIKNAPAGMFKYPYLSVTYSGFYSRCIFSWDNHHMSLALANLGEPEQLKYFLGNMLAGQQEDGFTPCTPNWRDGGIHTPRLFHAQPFLAQNAAIYLNKTGDEAFIREILPRLEKYYEHWFGKDFQSEFGLYHWGETYMSGIDNEIVGTLFHADEIIPPDLNSLLYLEARSMAFIAGRLGLDQQKYLDRAEQLKQAVNDRLWDEEYQCYGAYRLTDKQMKIGLNDPYVTSEVGKYAYLSITTLHPLLAGIATPERAECVIEKYLLNPRHFRSVWGVRSLSRQSEYCNNAVWGNPPRFGNPDRLTNSNWQGPVWILINWFAFQSLLNYGHVKAAEALKDDTMALLAQSIDRLGFMRENFNETTGEPLYADSFASWNLLAAAMPLYLKGEGLELYPGCAMPHRYAGL